MFVSGPPRAGKTRWLHARIRALAAATPPARCAVLLAEEGRTRWENFAREVPGLAVQRLVLPCLCCPALAHLPAAVAQLAARPGVDWLFLEVPAIAAAGLLAEFDRAVGWPREIVICTTEKWETVARATEPPFFMSNLVALADTVVPSIPDGNRSEKSDAVALPPGNPRPPDPADPKASSAESNFFPA